MKIVVQALHAGWNDDVALVHMMSSLISTLTFF
jgi:hypothetical protein